MLEMTYVKFKVKVCNCNVHMSYIFKSVLNVLVFSIRNFFTCFNIAQTSSKKKLSILFKTTISCVFHSTKLIKKQYFY